MSQRYIYLSGPITGLTYKQARHGWRQQVAENLQDYGIKVLSPMRHEGHLAELERKQISEKNLESVNHFFSQPKMIVAKDLLDIDMSDLVLANFQGFKKISQGSIAEIGYAYGKGKPIITVMEDNNVHNSVFIREMSDAVLDNMDDAINVIKSLMSEGY